MARVIYMEVVGATVGFSCACEVGSSVGQGSHKGLKDGSRYMVLVG